MLTIKRSKDEWGLYDTATPKDVDTQNRAANRAVLDALVEMQSEGVNMLAALNTALARARESFHKLAHVGAFDTEPLELLEHEVVQQFRIPN